MATVSPPVELHTVDEVADRLHLHERTVRNLIRRGDLGHVRIGKRVLVTTDQLATFIDAHRVDD